MKERLSLLHWMLVADTIICIVFHRIAIAQIANGKLTELVATVLQITIYGALLLIMAAFAGVAVWLWKKMGLEGKVTEEKIEFPRNSFIAAVISAVVFTLYWTIF